MRVNQANFISNASYRALNSSNKYTDELHQKRIIHIHDNEYTGVTYNCVGLSLKDKLLDLKMKTELFDIDDALNYFFETIVFLTNEQSGGIGFINVDEDLKEFCKNISENDLIKKIRIFFHKLNLPLRNGYEKAYVSFNLGLDTTNEGRKIIKSFLKAFKYGEIMTGAPFVFPNIIFKVKKGINRDIKDKNFDLFKLATEVSGIRMNPTYFNCDSTLVNFIEQNKVGIMGCRTLLANNLNGINGAINRGNIASISLNLPKIAKNSSNEEEFYKNLEYICNRSKEILLEKYEFLCKLDIEDFNYLLENEFYENSIEALEKRALEEIFKNGTLSIGFIGLFDCISYLKKEKLTIDFIDKNIKFARDILKFIRNLCDKWSKEYKLNFSILASPGEGISGRFAEEDETKEFYTNSFHVPVYLEIDAFKKIEIESNFVEYCNGGSISYIEFPTPVLYNNEAVIDVINYAMEKNIVYLGVNFPLDYCLNCKETGVFSTEKCPKCNSENLSRLRRVSGYLSHKSTLKGGKKAEEKMRKSHFKF